MPLMAHAGGVIEHDPLRHTAQPLEQVAQRRARALSVLARHQLHQTDVRIREIKHEMMIRCTTPRNSTSTSPKSACASPGCHTRSMNASSLRRELTPEPRHRPRHRGQGDSPPYVVPQPPQIPGRGMPKACASSRDPPRATARSRADTGRSRRALAFTDGHGRTDPPFARYLRTVGSLTCMFSARSTRRIHSAANDG